MPLNCEDLRDFVKEISTQLFSAETHCAMKKLAKEVALLYRASSISKVSEVAKHEPGNQDAITHSEFIQLLGFPPRPETAKKLIMLEFTLELTLNSIQKMSADMGSYAQVVNAQVKLPGPGVTTGS